MSANPNRITAISFDGDGTLWDFERVMRLSLNHTLAELHRLAPKTADSLTVDAMIAIRNEVARELKGRMANLEKVRLEAFRRTLQRVDIRDDDLAPHLNAVYRKHRFEDIQLFHDVLPALDAVQGRYTLGLISNGNTYPEHTGLGGRFQFVVFSEPYGIEKPDPRLFKIAMEQAGCSSRELLHVGDSLRDDVSGANAAGARSVWLNRERRGNDTGIQPDFEVSSLVELPEICSRPARP